MKNIVYLLLSMITCGIAGFFHSNTPTGAIEGLVTGGIMGCVAIALLLSGRARISFKQWNTALVGAGLGMLGGLMLQILLKAVIGTPAPGEPLILQLLPAFVLVSSVFAGICMALETDEALLMSIPFVRVKADETKSDKIILDASALSDPRIIDLAKCGLLDDRVVIPRFILDQLQQEASDEDNRRAHRALQTAQQLEALTPLAMHVCDEDYPEIPDQRGKVLKLARNNGWALLSAEISKVEALTDGETRLINLHELSRLLQPITKHGETLKIKIQRYGKEPMQGVGYLDDGTMVVVNGGGEFVGKTIDAHVLSVKHTTSGRMIFCNASQDEHRDVPVPSEKSTSKSKEDYFLV